MPRACEADSACAQQTLRLPCESTVSETYARGVLAPRKRSRSNAAHPASSTRRKAYSSVFSRSARKRSNSAPISSALGTERDSSAWSASYWASSEATSSWTSLDVDISSAMSLRFDTDACSRSASGTAMPVAWLERTGQRQRRLREGRLRQVVRHVHGEAHRLAVELAEPELQQPGEAGRHLHPVDPAPVALHELGVGGVRREGHRPGVRDRHRDAVQADRQPYVQLVDEPDHRRREPLPLHVRLRPRQEQEDLTVLVGHPVEPQLDVGVGLPLVGVEDHGRTPTAIVVQLIVVELGQHLVVELGQQMGGEQPAGLPRVDETVHLMDEHGAVLLELGQHVLVRRCTAGADPSRPKSTVVTLHCSPNTAPDTAPDRLRLGVRKDIGVIVSVFVRRLKQGRTFADFIAEWEADAGFGVPTRVFNTISLEDPRDVIPIGFVAVTPEEVRQWLSAGSEAEVVGMTGSTASSNPRA